MISTHGRDKPLMKIVKDVEKKSENISFKYVKKTAPSFKNILVKSKRASLGNPHGRTDKCGGSRNCKCCDVVSEKDYVTDFNGKVVKTAKGQCKSRCLIYHASCSICQKNYIGKTVQPLSKRTNGHRSNFYSCLSYRGDRRDLDDDDHLLGMHLYFQHGIRHRKGFNDSYRFTILEHCSPMSLDLKEHLWIHRLRTIKPYGLNSHDPFGIPLIL